TVIYEPVPGTNEGNYPNEIDASNSCVSSEDNSIWYTFTANTNGNLNFVITPDDLNDDYDWILFDITNATCGDIFNDPSLIVSCNAAGGAGCHGATGATGATPYNDQGGGCGTNPPTQFGGFSPFNDEVPMAAGNTYVLMVSNWTGSTNGYTLDFSASTGIGIFDTTPPFVANVDYPDDCTETEIIVEFSEYIQCATIDESNFTLTGTGGPYTITLSSTGCDVGGNQDNFFSITTTPPLDPMGSYTLNLITDGSTEVLDLCDNPASSETFNFSTNISLDNAPSVVPGVINICVGETVNIAPFSTSCTATPTFNFYDDPGLNNLILTGSLYSFTPASTTTIYVTEILGFCESPVTSVPVNVNALPDPPMASDPAPICAGDGVPGLTATGSGGLLYWYDSDPAIGNPSPVANNTPFFPNINTNLIGTYNFWVTEALSSTCEGPGTMVTVEILDAPAEPTGTTSYEICAGDAAPDLVANGSGGTLNWYDSDPDAGPATPIGTGSPFTAPLNTSMAGTYTYWVTETLGSSCESTGLEVQVQVNSGPEFVDITLDCAPDLLSYTADINFNNADGLTSNAGTITDNGGGSFTISGIDPSVDLSVTATNSGNSCTVMLDFTAPDCSCPDVNAPLSDGDQEICDGDPIPDLSVTVGAGETVDWYDASTGGTLLASGTTTFTPPGPGTYYAETRVEVNGCVSPRTAVSLTINPLPMLNSSTADCAPDLLSYVVTVSIANGNSITVNSGSVADNGGGNFTISGIDVNTDLNITATDASGSCSNTFTVPAPDCSCPDVDPPVSNGDQEVCEGDPIPALTVSVGAGETADWYDAPTGGTLLASGTTSYTPPGPGTYYAETRVIVNNCISATRTAVTLIVYPLPQLIDSQVDCAPDLLSYMVVLQVINADNINSSAGTVTNNGGGSFTISNIPNNTNISVLVTDNTTGCFTSFDFNAPDCSCPFVNPPVSNGDVAICNGDPIPPLTVNVGPGETVDWYDAAAGGTLLASGTTSFTPPGPGTYYAETRVIVNNCISSRTAISFVINPLPTLVNSQTDCSADLLTYTITQSVSDADIVQASSGTVNDMGGGNYTITDIDINLNISVLASNSATGCFASFDFNAPDCDCPDIDAPVSDGDIAICDGDPLPDLSVSVGAGETVDWYDMASGGTLLSSGSTTFTPAAAGTYYAETREAGTGCISNSRTAVTLTINPLPTLTDEQANCAADLLTYSVDVTFSGADMISVSEGTVTDNGGGSFTIDGVDVNNDLTITASNTATGCMDDFTIIAPVCGCGTIDPPVSDGDVAICEDESIPALSVTVGVGETVDWYDAATDGTLLLADSPTYTPAAAGTYYAETHEIGTDCLSATRTAVTLTINPLPVLDNATTDCAADLLTYSVTIMLTNADSVTPSEGVVTDNGGGSFTIDGIDVNNDLTITATDTGTSCSDDFTINAPNCNCPTIDPPVSDGDVAICDGDAIPELSVTVGAGETVDWYNADTGGTLLLADSPTYTPAGAGTYYAETREVGTDCLSATRTGVTLTINPLPVLNSSQTTCSADLLTYTVNITLTDADNISVSEGSVTDNGGGSFTISGVDINNDLTVTGINSVTSCEDDFVIAAPDCNCPTIDPPVSGGDEAICEGDAFPALSATPGAGQTIDWYDAAAGGTLLLGDSQTFTPSAAGTYFAEAREINSGCVSSSRTAIILTINPLPSIIDSTTVCSADLLSYSVSITFADADNIIAGSGTVTDNGGGSFTIDGIDPASNLVILALNTTTGCSDNFIITAPDCSCPDVDAPVNDGDQAICDGDAIPALSATVGAGETIDWYDADSGGTLLLADSPTYTPATAGTYYAETRVIVNGCLSSVRTPITLTMNPLPTLTDSQADCAPDLQTYAVTVTFADADNITVSEGTVTDNGGGSFTVSGVDPANDLMITANNSVTSCSDNFTITAPDCSCPVVDAPVSNGDLEFCDGDAIPELSVSVNAGETVDWYDAATGGTLLVSGSTTFTPAGVGTYYAETRVEINGCLSATRTPVMVSMNPLPTLTDSQADCALDLQSYSVTVTFADADGISVSEGNVTDNGGGSFTIDGVNPANDLVITATNSVTTCSDNFTVTAPDCSCPVVDAPVSDGDLSICDSDPIPALSVSVGAGETVDWYDAAAGGTLLLADSPTYTPAGAGTYYAETRVIVNSCVSGTRTPVTLTVNSVDVPVSGGNEAICDGEALPQLSASVGAGETIDWYDAATGGTLLASDSPTYTPTMEGTYYAEARDLNNGCISNSRVAVTLTINVLPGLAVTNATDPGCGLDNGSIALDAIGGQSPYTYQIDGSGFGNSNTFADLAAGGYSFDIEDANGCQGSIDTTLFAPVGVTAVANVTDTLTCAVTDVVVDGNATTSDGTVTYEWTFNGNEISTEITAQASEPGMYILTAFQDACSSADTIEVAQNLSPGLSALLNTENQLDCNITDALLDGTASSTGADISYEWYMDGSLIGGANLNTYNANTEGTYILFVTDEHTGCVVSDTLQLINNENYPVADAGQDATITCAITSVTADGSGSQSGNEIIYQWSDPSGNPINGATTTTLEVTTPGTYYLMVQDTTNGCSNTDEMIVNTDLVPPVANAGIQMQLDCNETTLDLNGQGTSVGPEYTYAWTTDVPGTGSILSGANSLTPTIGGPGNYYLAVTDNDNGCTSSDQTFVTQVATIPTDFDVVAEDAGCYGESNGFITVAAQDPGLQILYAFNDQAFTSNAQYSGLAAGSYSITAEDASGCQWDTTVVIQEGIELQLDLGEDLFILLGDSVHLQPQINFPQESIASLNWTNRELLACPDCFDPMTYLLTNSSTFQLDIVDEDGCPVSDDITIFVDKERRVFIPNVFSPNSDGVNDILFINSGTDVVQVKSFIIANRWGEVVFEQFNFSSNDSSSGWDGRFRGEYLNPGVFVFVAEIEFVDGEVETYSGDIILMR
ncbi:MAG: hypothetical protein DWQ02_17200, partial [Bacteroidetes bacterium]